MITSVLVRRRPWTGCGRPEGRHRRARSGITRVVCAAAAGGIAVVTAGLAGAAAPARAATATLGPPEYSSAQVGYETSGRWFRYVSTTVTVPPQVLPRSPGSQSGDAVIDLYGIGGGGVTTQITVAPAGGPVSWGDPGGSGTFRISPRTGDRLTLSIYYDQHGHVYLTATDLTRHTTQTVRTSVPNMIYTHARLFAWVYNNDVTPPAADTPLWQFTNSRLTTYRGDHGTIVGPWATSQMIDTTTSTASGTVIASPSGLSNGGQDFGVWLRALPVAYTSGYAGYEESGGPFRFIATTVTVPARQDPLAGHEQVLVGLNHPGGTKISPPEAGLGVLAGGGKNSVHYTADYSAAGYFTISPNVGDQLTVSIYYDQHGHYLFTATDLTQHTTQTITATAVHADRLPLNRAKVLAWVDNDAVVPPPADVRLWAVTGTRVTTYGGTRGSILGPWATSQTIDTTDATAAGAVVMSPAALSNAGQNFTVWLRHR